MDRLVKITTQRDLIRASTVLRHTSVAIDRVIDFILPEDTPLLPAQQEAVAKAIEDFNTHIGHMGLNEL